MKDRLFSFIQKGEGTGCLTFTADDFNHAFNQLSRAVLDPSDWECDDIAGDPVDFFGTDTDTDITAKVRKPRGQ